MVYCNKDLLDCTILDFNQAISLKPDYAIVYYNRGGVWLHLREWEKVKLALMAASDMGVDITTAIRNNYGNVAGFERITGIQLPKDIATMLMPLT